MKSRLYQIPLVFIVTYVSERWALLDAHQFGHQTSRWNISRASYADQMDRSDPQRYETTTHQSLNTSHSSRSSGSNATVTDSYAITTTTSLFDSQMRVTDKQTELPSLNSAVLTGKLRNGSLHSTRLTLRRYSKAHLQLSCDNIIHFCHDQYMLNTTAAFN